MILRCIGNLAKRNNLRSIKMILNNQSPLFRFAIQNKSQKRFQEIRMHTTLSQYPGLNTDVMEHVQNSIELIDDKQTGLKFLVEAGGFAGCSSMGICVKLGTQDQNEKNAGSLQYLKSFVHMKPTFEQLVSNYQILHQTGSFFDLNYDSMTTYGKCSFLEQDQDLMVDLLLDLVIREKNMFEDNHVTFIELDNINQLVRRVAFGNKGLGMPSKGVGNTLTNVQFIKFQKKITPKNMIISMSNITNPSNFIEKIKQKIKTRYSQFLKRIPQKTPKSTYVGGLDTFKSDGQDFQFAIALPSVNSRSQHMELYNILRILIGNASSFSSGGPGKGMHSRATKNLLNQIQCVQKASFINEHFEDYGLFGLTVGGPHQDKLEIIKCTLSQFSKLIQLIPQQQLDRAKHILISSIYQNIQRQSDRLQQLTKHVFYYDRIKIYEFQHNIRKITAKEVQSQMNRIFKQKPTFVYSGNQDSLKGLPSGNELTKMFSNFIQDSRIGKN